jgi:hypothetical protein
MRTLADDLLGNRPQVPDRDPLHMLRPDATATLWFFNRKSATVNRKSPVPSSLLASLLYQVVYFHADSGFFG